VNDAMHALPADPLGFVLAHPSVRKEESAQAHAPVEGEATEAGRDRVRAALEKHFSAAISLALVSAPPDPAEFVLERLRDVYSKLSTQ